MSYQEPPPQTIEYSKSILNFTNCRIARGMIFVKNGITLETMILILAYAESDECKFRVAVKPPTDNIRDHVFYMASVINFQKVEEVVRKIDRDDPEDPLRLQTRFNVRIVVDDNYYEPFTPTEKGDNRYMRPVPVPGYVFIRVADIFNS